MVTAPHRALIKSSKTLENKGFKGVSTLVKHYGQEKVDEMEIECTDETQLKVANDLIAEAKDIMSYCGSGDGTNKEDCGALERYYFFDDTPIEIAH